MAQIRTAKMSETKHKSEVSEELVEQNLLVQKFLPRAGKNAESRILMAFIEASASHAMSCDSFLRMGVAVCATNLGPHGSKIGLPR